MGRCVWLTVCMQMDQGGGPVHDNRQHCQDAGGQQGATGRSPGNHCPLTWAPQIDLEGERQVSKEDGRQFAKENGMLFIETSARTNVGVANAFEELVLKILDSPALTGTSFAPSGRLAITTDGGAPESSSCAC